MRKLTLSAEPEVIDRAKRLADRCGTSVSEMFSQFVRAMDTPASSSVPIGPLTKKATGLVKLPRGKSARKLIEEALAERYLR